MEQGPTEQSINTQAANMGRATPRAIQEKPILHAGNEMYQHAFYDLDGERHLGMSVGRIPWSAIETYANVNRYDFEQRYALHYLLSRMDGLHLQRIADSIKPKDKINGRTVRPSEMV